MSSFSRWIFASDGFYNAEGMAGRANIVDHRNLMGQIQFIRTMQLHCTMIRDFLLFTNN